MVFGAVNMNEKELVALNLPEQLQIASRYEPTAVNQKTLRMQHTNPLVLTASMATRLCSFNHTLFSARLGYVLLDQLLGYSL